MNNSGVPQKDDTNPRVCSRLQWEMGRLGRPGSRPLSGSNARGTAAGRHFAHLRPKLCVPCQSHFDLNFVLAFPKQIRFQMPKSVFSPVFRSVQKIPRLSGQTTDVPNNHPTGKRNSSHVILKLVFAAAELYPHPLQSHISKVL